MPLDPSQISHHPPDSNAEISVLRDQLAATQARASSQTVDSSIPARTSSERSSHVPRVSKSLEDDLLHTQPPPDLELPDFPPEAEIPISVPDAPRPSTSSAGSESGQSILLQRAGFPPRRHKMSTPQTPVTLSRSTTLPSLPAASRIPPRTVANRTTSHASGSSAAPPMANGAVSNTSKSRGVQMVSEMRAKVKNLEQKIHTRVPRLRMGSMSRPSPVTAVPTSNSKTSSLSSAGSSQSIKSPDDRPRTSLLSRRNAADVDETKRTPAGSSSGWVLIMEDSPSPTKPKPKERDHRRASSPPSAAGLPALASLTNSIQSGSLGTPDVSQNAPSSGLRRPLSRLSTSTEGRSSISTTATVSSIPTPVSRPATPTFIPFSSSGLYAHPSTAGATGLKRPSGAGFGGAYLKRSSLGSTAGDSPPSASLSDSGISRSALPSLASHAAASPTSTTSTPSHKESSGGKPLSQIPHPNVTVRSQSKLPTPTGPLLSQSRIGRPSLGASGRRSTGADNSDVESRFLDARDKGRPRSGSGRS
jgi:hypothetical protein